MQRLLPLVTIALLAAAPVAAQQDVARVELLPGWRDGARHMAGVRISLLPGWKTYWRAPGEAGIPPQFNWSGSRNLAGVRVHWPVPEVFGQNGLNSVGYHDGVVLPLEVIPRDPSRPVSLRLDLDMGVCQDICVPHEARLAALLPAKATAPDPAIRAAIADRPLSEDEARVGRVDCTLDLTSDGASLTARVDLPSLGGEEYAVVELPDRELWISEAETDRTGATFFARAEVVAPRDRPLSFDRSDLRLTVLGRNGAVDIHGCD